MAQLHPLPSLSPRAVPGAVELTPETVEALAVVHAWGRAFDERDLDRLLELSADDCELATRDVSERGHDALRRFLHLQTYGVAQHIRPRRYFARGATVVVDAVIELRWVETGELADTTHGAAVIDVRDRRVSRFRPQPELPSALQAAGWAEARTTGAPTD